MSDKWQQINLRLDAELAQALRELKRGHDESLAEVVIRVLKKVVRQNPVGARGAPARRSNLEGGAARGPRSKDRAGRGAVGRDRKGKPMAAAARTSSSFGAGKPWAPAARDAEEGGRKPAWLAQPRGPRRSTGKVAKAGKPARSELAGSSEPRRRNFRPGTAAPRSLAPHDELGSEERPKRMRRGKGPRSNGR